MGTFDEKDFCNILEEQLNEEWNKIIERAKERQREKLEELEERIKAWEALNPPSFDRVILYHEGEGRFFDLNGALKSVREKGMRRTFKIVYKEGKKYYYVATLTIEVGDTLESLRATLERRYRNLLEEYKATKESFTPFIDREALKEIGELAALKRQIC